MGLLLILAATVIGLPLLLVLYRSLQGYAMYKRAVDALGKNSVVFLNRPHMTFKSFYNARSTNGMDSLGILTDKIRKNPNIKIIVLTLFYSASYFVCDPEMIRWISSEHSHKLEKRKIVLFSDALLKGLIVSEGETWKKSRSIISNLFHFDVLRSRQAIIYKIVDKETQRLDERNVDLFEMGTTITGQIVLESLLGKDFEEFKFEGNYPLKGMAQLLTDILTETSSFTYLLRCVIFGVVRTDSKHLTEMQSLILARLLTIKRAGYKYIQQQKQKQNKGSPIAPFVEAYLNLNDESYYDEVIEQIFIFLFAGQQTTGQMIEMCLYELAEHPEYQDSLLKSFESESNLNTNKQLSNFINETSRLSSPIRCGLMRKVVKPFVVDGFEFKEGQNLQLNFAGTMTNAKYFEDPWEFIPDRFNSPLKHPHSFMPFSGGPRNCIGQHMAIMEVRVAVASILKKYSLQRTAEPLQMKVYGLIARPSNHNLVQFVLRR